MGIWQNLSGAPIVDGTGAIIECADEPCDGCGPTDCTELVAAWNALSSPFYTDIDFSTESACYADKTAIDSAVTTAQIHFSAGYVSIARNDSTGTYRLQLAVYCATAIPSDRFQIILGFEQLVGFTWTPISNAQGVFDVSDWATNTWYDLTPSGGSPCATVRVMFYE